MRTQQTSQRRLLSDVIDLYLTSRRDQYAPASLRAAESTLRLLLADVGNIQIGNIRPHHLDGFRARRQAKVAPASMNVHAVALRAFFRWCREMGILGQTANPMVTWRTQRVMPREKLYIPAGDFPALLDATTHPRDRAIVAIGMYLFLRSGEIATLRIQDVDLARDEMAVAIHKTKQRDLMPICSELRVELERWLAYYRSEVGHLANDMFLVPAKTSPKWEKGGGSTPAVLQPYRRAILVHGAVQRALDSLDLPVEREGGHTLRRSGARALYDKLASEGHDRAIRYVQAMLHHSSINTTETYLGITADVRARNVLIGGKNMFTQPEAAATLMVVAS